MTEQLNISFNDELNTGFIDSDYDDSEINHLTNNLSVCSFSNCYCDHNLNETSALEIMKDMEIGSWILWNYTPIKDNGIRVNAITIKLQDDIVHHKNFIFRFSIEEDDIIEFSKNALLFENKITIKKSYKTFHEYLLVLNKIYGLDIEKQVIYEDG
jgi:hypothetical protein